MALTELNHQNWVTTAALAADELWQVRDGVLLVTFEAPASLQQGILLHHKDMLSIPAGKVVRYRAISATALINRELAS